MTVGERVRVTRAFAFCAGHRLRGHEGACVHLHGHNYRVEITVESDWLDPVGRVIDFKEIEEKVFGWIQNHWDHGFLLDRRDEEVAATIAPLCRGGSPYLMDNPTAENIAKELFHRAEEVIHDERVQVVRVVVGEMDGMAAEYLSG